MPLTLEQIGKLTKLSKLIDPRFTCGLTVSGGNYSLVFRTSPKTASNADAIAHVKKLRDAAPSLGIELRPEDISAVATAERKRNPIATEGKIR